MIAQPTDSVLGEEATQFYRHLLRSEPAGVAIHAESLGWPARQAQRAMRELERLRLAHRSADGVVRTDDPRVTVGRLLTQQESDLDHRRRQLLLLRESLETFEVDYRRGRHLSGPRLAPMEQVSPAEAAGVVEHLFRSTEGSVLQVAAHVQVATGGDIVRPHWKEAAASGRELRTIFPMSVLTDPFWHPFARARSEAGEQQRYLADDELIVEFGIFGRAAVLIEEGRAAESDQLLLRPGALIDVFSAFFEELWRRAEPVATKDASRQDAKVLELLGLGFKDEAIARQMGLGLRTVRRRIAALMDEHGAATRFQLGMAVGRRRVGVGGPDDRVRRSPTTEREL